MIPIGSYHFVYAYTLSSHPVPSWTDKLEQTNISIHANVFHTFLSRKESINNKLVKTLDLGFHQIKPRFSCFNSTSECFTARFSSRWHWSKTWIQNNNWETMRNWNLQRLPCAGDIVKIDLVIYDVF